MRAVFRRHLPRWVVLWPAVGRRARAAWPDTLVYGRVPASVPDKRLGDAASRPPGRIASCASAHLGLANGPGASADLPGTQDTGLQLPPGWNAPATAPSRVLWQWAAAYVKRIFFPGPYLHHGCLNSPSPNASSSIHLLRLHVAQYSYGQRFQIRRERHALQHARGELSDVVRAHRVRRIVGVPKGFAHPHPKVLPAPRASPRA